MHREAATKKMGAFEGEGEGKVYFAQGGFIDAGEFKHVSISTYELNLVS